MIAYYKETDEVLYTTDAIVKIDSLEIEKLKLLALKNPRERIRICTHKSSEDILHEMIIVHTKNCYVRPHRHIRKSESLFVLEGIADAVIFNESGDIDTVIKLGPFGSDRKFYYRIDSSVYHTLVIYSDFFVFHEVTSGPFEKSRTAFPPWAPENDNVNSDGYIEKLSKLISKD